MDFAALGTDIFISTHPRFYDCAHHDVPPTFVYYTKTAALAVAPRLPVGIHALGAAMAAGEKLYALITASYPDAPSVQALSLGHTEKSKSWDPEIDWVWNRVVWNRVESAPPFCGRNIVAYALHPDGRTIFMSTASLTQSFDTGNGLWKELGDWVLPFRGQAYFDADLDAWVGIHRKYEGYVCCCPVASRSAAARRPPECTMLNEKLFRRNNEETWEHDGRHLKASLAYLGDSGFCLVECILRSPDAFDAVLHVTFFGLKYDHRGELCTKVRRATRSYAVSKNTHLFSHAAFWM